jgi:hypothetical protein
MDLRLCLGRHAFLQGCYQMSIWPKNDKALVRRAGLTFWSAEEALADWQASLSGKRGGRRVHDQVGCC